MDNPYANDNDKVLMRMATLKDINLKIRSGKLTVIIGPVASGKSTLISALTSGEAFIEGSVQVANSHAVCYAEQSPWLQSGTIKSNILFGRKEDPVEYEKVLTCCGLDADLQRLDNGDLTKVGEQGVRLSGGQRARVAMARACYSRSADLFIFDDSLAALDAIVSQEVFINVFKKRLAKRTRILITHDPRWFEQAHDVIVIDGNSIAWAGPQEVLKDVVESSSLLKSMMNKLEETHRQLQMKAPERVISAPSRGESVEDENDDAVEDTISLRARAESVVDRTRADSCANNPRARSYTQVLDSGNKDDVPDRPALPNDDKPQRDKRRGEKEKSDDDEDVTSTGSVSGKVYADYFHEFGGLPVSPFGILNLLENCSNSLLVFIHRECPSHELY